MGNLRDYHKQLEKKRTYPAEKGRDKELVRRTGHLREVPSRVGLSLAGFNLLVIVCLIIFGLFLFLLFTIPKYDYIVEKRLGDNYRTKFSDPLPDPSGMPEGHERLQQPVVTDMDQDDERVYLATRGHGIQVVDKDNSLWKTFDARNTGGELKNDIQEIDYQETQNEERLWSLGLDGSISLGDIHGSKIEFDRLFATGFWRYFTREEITAALMIGDECVVIGTSSKGAGVYHIKNHMWQDFPEIRDHVIKKIIFQDNMLWFLTNQGVFVYKVNSNTRNELAFRILPRFQLEAGNLTDMRVFDKDHAIAFTEDRGCYILKRVWSDKLLGGRMIPGLTQENIRYSLSWQNLMVVIGETFGVAAYDPVKRNWTILKRGPLPTLNGFDHDQHTIVLASDNGAFVIKKSTSDHLFQEDSVRKVSLLDCGFVYLLHSTDSTKEKVGWISLDGKKNILIGNSSLNINQQPRITDILVHKGDFLIATESDGVLRYSLNGRVLEQINHTESGELNQVKRLGTHGHRIISLCGGNLYQWGGEKWDVFREGVHDFRQDPKTSELWLHTLDGSVVHETGIGSEKKWFTGRGPKKLNLSSAWAVLSPSKNDPKIYFPEMNTRKMYVYHFKRGNWQEPYDIPGKHSFRLFAPRGNNVFCLNQNGHIYFDDQFLLGGGHPDFSMSDVLLAKQEGGINSKTILFGPRRENDYEPVKGKWTSHDPYPFLKGNEKITDLFSVQPQIGGRLAKTSANRLLIIDETWQSAAVIGRGISSEQFDGCTFWKISNSVLVGQTLKKTEGDKIVIDKSNYFSGIAPDLSEVLEAWYSEPYLYLVTPHFLATYDTSSHCWKSKEFRQGRIVKAKRKGDLLQVITKERIHNLSYPDLEGESIVLPRGEFKKLSIGGGEKVVTVGENQTRKVFYRNKDEWNALTWKRSRFTGRLDSISHIFKFGNALWVYDPAGNVGRYAGGNWSNFRVSSQFKLTSFWEGPEGRLFLIGRRGDSDETDLPLYYLQKNELSLLTPLPARISKVRFEKERYLWVQADNADIFIYDLFNPQNEGLNLTEVYLSAQSRLTTSLHFNFSNSTFSKVPIHGDDRAFRARLVVEEPNEIRVQRDAKNMNITKIFVRTGRAIYCFEQQNGGWYLTAEYRVSGKIQFKEALKRISSCDHPVDPVNFAIDLAHFRLSISKIGYNPILNLLKNNVIPGRFRDQPSKEFEKIRDPLEVSVGSVKVVLSNKQPQFYALTTSGKHREISHSNGRFEIDRPFIDATVNSSGQWIVLRKNSLTFYSDRSFNQIVEFGKLQSGISGRSFIEIVTDKDDEKNLIHSPRGMFSAEMLDGKVQLSGYSPREVKTGIELAKGFEIELVKGFEKAAIRIGNRRFAGRGRFHFDKIKKVAASQSKIYVMTSRDIWNFATNAHGLSSAACYSIPDRIRGQISFVNCTNGEVRLRAGQKFFEISHDFQEIKRDNCLKPCLVAREDHWNWYMKSNRKGIFFEAKINGKWQRISRQTRQKGFLDDTFSWIIAFEHRIYAAHGAGIIRLSEKGREKEFLIGTNIRELKPFGGSLYALAQNSWVYKLTGDNKWEREASLSAQVIFGQFTELYSDPFIRIEGRHENIRFRTTPDNRILSWHSRLRKFKTDVIRDFAVNGSRLFIINDQNGRIVSYDKTGMRSGYHLSDHVIKQFEMRDGNLRAIGLNMVFLMNPKPKDITWQGSSSYIDLASHEGLLFQKNLLARDNISIYPVIGEHPIKEFWTDGRFSFDGVTDIECGASSWWASTPAGLIRLKDKESAPFEKAYPCRGRVSRMNYRFDRLNLEIRGDEKYLKEDSGEFVPVETPAFTKTVFDFSRDEAAYKWKVSEVSDRGPRPTFYLNTPWRDNDPDVFYEHRFSWDQIIRGAYKPDARSYWIVTPRRLIRNIMEMEENLRCKLTLSDFSHMEMEESSEYELADAVFHNGVLFTLFTALDNDTELVRKRTERGWENAGSDEYPFWQPAVEFRLRDNIWKRKEITHTQYYARNNNFAFIGPDDYPIFTELDWAEGYGKFSFDYLRSIHPVDNTLWAGSKGGFLKFRYLPYRASNKLELEQILLPEDGLCYYAVEGLKEQKSRAILRLLESDDRENEIIQDFTLPLWQKINAEEVTKKAKEVTLPGRGDVKYLFEYDPVEDRGVLSLQTPKNGKIDFLRYVPKDNPEKRLRKRGPGQYAFTRGQEIIEFDTPKGGSDRIFSRLKRKSGRLSGTTFTPKVTDPAGLAWGELTGELPAIRLPAGDIVKVTGLLSIKGLRVDKKELAWIIRQEKGERTFYYDAETAKVKEIKDSEEEYEWVEYTPPAGTGISHYLLNRGIVKEQNFFKRLFGRKQPELQRWVLIVAKKNNIFWGGKGELDYPLKQNTTYLMPRKAAEVKKVATPQEHLVTIGEKGYRKFGEQDQQHSGILEHDLALLGFAETYFLEFDLARDRVLFQPLPSKISPRHLWQEGDRILMSFVGGEEDNELWCYTPQRLNDSNDISPSEFKRVYVKKSNRTLEAAPDRGFIVDDGKRSMPIVKSSEWFFGTNLSRVIDILEDNKGNGYWIVTDTSGLIWSRDPF